MGCWIVTNIYDLKNMPVGGSPQAIERLGIIMKF